MKMWTDLLNHLRGNPRLRWWLALIVGVMGLYGVLLLHDALQVAERQYNGLAQSISRLEAQSRQTEWLARVAPAKAVAVQLEGRLWQAPTAGLAQAALQDWLSAALVDAKATKPLISVTVLDEIATGSADGGAGSSGQPNPSPGAGGAAATPPDLWKVKAKLGFDYTAPTLLALLSRIENNDKQLIVDVLTVRKEPLAHVELEVMAYFQKQAGPDKVPGPATSTDLPPLTPKPVASP